MADLKTARVTYSHKRPPYWEITAPDGRWWSVACRKAENGLSTYVVTNTAGRILDEFGPTGRKLIDIVHDFERGTTRG